MNKITETGKKTVEYLQKFPNAKTKTLASMLNRDFPALFTSVETARSAVRYYRHASGNEKSTRTDLIREKQKPGNPFELPETHADDYKRIKLAEADNRILLLSDIHLPYHDIDALTAALEYGKKREVNTIVLNGDTIDMYHASSFTKNPQKKPIRYELDVTIVFIDLLQREFPKARIVFKVGNHEERIERLLFVKAPELIGIDEFKLDVLLQLGAKGIQYVDRKRMIMAGKLAILHGHEFGRSVFSPVNPARGLYMRSKESAIIGHHHQTSEHTEPSLHGDIVTTWSTGCLCGLTPEYMPINKWNHGFAYIETDPSGDYKVHNKRIYKGRIV